jgi:hypothetical protein
LSGRLHDGRPLLLNDFRVSSCLDRRQRLHAARRLGQNNSSVPTLCAFGMGRAGGGVAAR